MQAPPPPLPSSEAGAEAGAQPDWRDTFATLLGITLFVSPCAVVRIVSTWMANYAAARGANTMPGSTMAAFLARLGAIGSSSPGDSLDMRVALAPPPLVDPRAPPPPVPMVFAFFTGAGGGAWDLALTDGHCRDHAAAFGVFLYNFMSLATRSAPDAVADVFQQRRQEVASGLVHIACLARPDVLRRLVDPAYLVVVAVSRFVRAFSQLYAAQIDPTLRRSVLDNIADALARLSLSGAGVGGGGGAETYRALAQAVADPTTSFPALLEQLAATERAWHEAKAAEYEREWKLLLRAHHVRLVLLGDADGAARD